GMGKIDGEGVRRLEEAVRLNKQGTRAPVSAGVAADQPEPRMPDWHAYMRGAVRNIRFDLLSDSDKQPRVTRAVAPYYPPELLDQKLSGEVVIDLQITDEGKVGGIWLVSAMPEVFGSLATASVRDWEFEGVSGKVRVVLGFNP